MVCVREAMARTRPSFSVCLSRASTWTRLFGVAFVVDLNGDLYTSLGRLNESLGMI